ncbi:MAG: TolC family protein [Prevotella sp.]|uniref:TolC family protein n=1 Tax=Segatella copri TaxID=165179 RepID=UPI003F89BC30|nr:TolC family protein [Prevotella sp.]
MNRHLLLAMVLSASLSTQAITLKESLQMTHDNYPAIRQYQLIEQTRDFTLENASKGWLPQVSASAGAYAFTDPIKSNEQIARMGIDFKNYMANASVTIRQNLYDGGEIAAQKEVTSAQSEVQKHQLHVSMYGINERVQQIYFSILLLDEQIVLNELHQKDLSTSEKNIRSLIKGGIANQSDLDAILVECLKLKQQKDAIVVSRQAYLQMLGVFIGKELMVSEKLEKPSMESNVLRTPEGTTSDSSSSLFLAKNWGINRPELQYYDSQNLLIDARRKQLDTRLRPTLSLFGMGMLHSKVSDMINYGMLAGGISLSWNIGALYTRKNDIRKLEVQRQMNDIQREVFLFNNRLQNEQEYGIIASLRKQIAQDTEIISLRESIRSKSDRKVQLGTESVNELVRDINAVNLAKTQKAMHEIQLLQEIYKLKYINND